MLSNLLAALPAPALPVLLGQSYQVGHGLIELAGNTRRVTTQLTGTTTHILHSLGQSAEEIGYNAHGST